MNTSLGLMATMTLVNDIAKRFNFAGVEDTEVVEPVLNIRYQYLLTPMHGSQIRFEGVETKNDKTIQIILTQIIKADGSHTYELYIYDGKRRDFSNNTIEHRAFVFISEMLKEVQANHDAQWNRLKATK
ncbi:hypothetical protein UFOVP569_16 [uncultured Caudovirales phage]|uniref:Uncharacterized protein n=1 Tax=uncultured Caudovirales phage TaxID=2100421 RepID=A0A6J5SVH8_9CAUD|nr:hypothetical protein UFOVP569_16 [uncultured Caudovirales phage]CAB4183132.1 hypothetical protein UFOVP1093_35 [uncultured Caudovirales phage]CAB4200227.1 hypothetical protein UFOVP1340_34 [uncultured Caudovirales phage]CAB4213550.1 hypothetical protein UFOVP1448_44 [uncultured Caudovirales phage]CAB4218437.1 hypothetical protein UFOVP1600_15 [uncultured Caudovirales phage]